MVSTKKTELWSTQIYELDEKSFLIWWTKRPIGARWVLVHAGHKILPLYLNNVATHPPTPNFWTFF